MAYTLIKSLPAIDREQEFRGLSTDTKPTVAENGVPVLNGAVFTVWIIKRFSCMMKKMKYG